MVLMPFSLPFSGYMRGKKPGQKNYLGTKKNLHEITFQTNGNGSLVILNVFPYYANACKG